MELIFKGSAKELAALNREVQARQAEAMSGDYDAEKMIKGLGLLADLREKGLLQIGASEKPRQAFDPAEQSCEE